MTHIEQLRQLLSSFQCPYLEETQGDYDGIEIRNNYKDNPVKGYTGFYTVFHFDKKDGSFVSVAAYE